MLRWFTETVEQKAKRRRPKTCFDRCLGELLVRHPLTLKRCKTDVNNRIPVYFGRYFGWRERILNPKMDNRFREKIHRAKNVQVEHKHWKTIDGKEPACWRGTLPDSEQERTRPFEMWRKDNIETCRTIGIFQRIWF